MELIQKYIGEKMKNPELLFSPLAACQSHLSVKNEVHCQTFYLIGVGVNQDNGSV